jgi:quinoprotein glucose dehydrogenase
LLHRETGESLFPLREEAVNGPGVAGEFAAQSQPLPTRPPPFTRQEFTLATVSDRTPEVHAELTARVRELRHGPLYTPPSVEGSIAYPGTDGGAEWGGAAWDAETGLLYVNANQVPAVLQMIETDIDDDRLRSPAGGYVFVCAGCHGLDMRGSGSAVPSLIDGDERMGMLDVYRTIRDGRGRMPGFAWLKWYEAAAIAFFVATADAEDAPSEWRATGPERTFVNAGYQQLLDADGLPGSKPPWGTLSAIDLSDGEIRWQVPLGDYPKLLALGESGLGAENYGGPVVTAGGLVFIAATPDARLRAFDKRSGALLWQAPLPNAGFATPAVYEAAGRQFVVIAAGGGKLDAPSGGEYVAFALPQHSLTGP